MDFSLIGKEIKILRSALNLSQAELSEGICTQSQISKIEKGEVYPLANTLYYIAERLGVDINYFYDLATNPQLSYVKEVFVQVRNLMNRSEFEEVYAIVENERKNPLFINNRKNKQFLLSTEGICIYHLKKDKKEALRLLQNALDLTKMTSKLLGEREIEILNSMAIVHFETNNCEDALIIFNRAIESYMKLPYHQDPTIKTKILYNKAKTLTRLKRLEESNDTCIQAIKWCVKQNSLYGLGNLYYHIGYNYSLLQCNDIAIEYYNKSIHIFIIQENKIFVKHIKEKINELSVLME
ncbi:Helix-turn-helix domain protein [Bacillus sp. THAF10]|uniref:helix-turn-helix domain-containing protein n=1 Tax=Bacillus sp. THAF10 TaxID=2587848 RepID=UPI001268FD61|nr:helix-turn-helix domain-containing protein [Bacillus sp. THAF10]QFT89945.1 Helix-turn-helix domain protein [Bacillus sp. THAF10]